MSPVQTPRRDFGLGGGLRSSSAQTDRQINKLETIEVSSLFVCLSVCLSVGKINQKVADTFS